MVPVILLRCIDNYYGKRSELYIHNEVQMVTSDFFAETINEINFTPTSDLVTYQYDNNQYLTSIMINNQVINQYLVISSKLIKTKLESNVLDEKIKDLTFTFGQLISPTYFAHLGPIIHIKTMIVDSYKVDISSKMIEYGINNALFEIYLTFKIDLEVIIPLNKQKITTTCMIPIFTQALQGAVPRFYFNGN